MKIVLVTETFPPEVNGVAMTLHRVTEGLSDRGHSLEVVCPFHRDRAELALSGNYTLEMVPGLPIPRYDDLRFGLPARSRLLCRWRVLQPDLVHIATEGPLGWSAMRAARGLGIPYITTFHTNFHRYGAHYGYGFLNKVVLRWLRSMRENATATFVPSETVREELAQAGFSRLSILGRGVDTVLYDPAKRDERLRASWGATPDTPVALYVGRVASEKNIPLTFRAYQAMRNILPDLKLVVVGDGPERAALEQTHPEVRFAGMRRGEDLARHYAAGDVFLFASLSETFGNVVTEAMASGLVVLGHDYAAPHQYIRDGDNGRLAPFGDTEGFLAAACSLAMERESWPSLRSAARATALDLSWDAILDHFESELCALVNHLRPSPAPPAFVSA